MGKKTDVAEIGGFPYVTVQLFPGESPIDSTVCYCRVRPWHMAVLSGFTRWGTGAIHLTTKRIIWTPMVFTPFDSRVLVDRAAVVGVREDNTMGFPLWVPFKWTVETASRSYAFSFGIFSEKKRRQWLELVARWATQ